MVGPRRRHGTALTTAAALFVVFSLLVAAFAFLGICGWLFGGCLSRPRFSRHRNLGGFGLARTATA